MLRLTFAPARRFGRCLLLCSALAIVSGPSGLYGQSADAAAPPQSAASAPDVIVFTNGDQLSGKLLREKSGTVTFHSDIAGDINVSWDKIKTLRSGNQFAVVRQDQKVLAGKPNPSIAQGALAVADGQLSVSSSALSGAAPAPIPVAQAQYVIDEKTFQTEVVRNPPFTYGWNGAVTLGATLVESTQRSETLTGAVNFVRAIPTVDWLNPRNKTSLNLAAAYGLVTQPLIQVGGRVIQTASSAKTNILHGDLERDEYITPRLYYLVDASADHNIGSGLRLQQTYGGGFGFTVFKQPKQELDLKADLHYQQQQFYNGENSPNGTPTVNLIGANFTEIYSRKLPLGLLFNETGTISPAFNVPSAYSALGTANLVFPVYKRLSFTLGSQDNFLNDPPLGFKKNSFLFTAGLTYALK